MIIVSAGKLINLEEDKHSASISTAERVGKQISEQERRKVLVAGFYDTGAEDFTVRADLNTNYSMGGEGAHPPVEDTADPVRPTDQISEYKSEYGEEGYKISEYKPMY